MSRKKLDEALHSFSTECIIRTFFAIYLPVHINVYKFCFFSPPAISLEKSLWNIRIKRLRTKSETFTIIFIFRMTVYNSDTNVVPTIFLYDFSHF